MKDPIDLFSNIESYSNNKKINVFHTHIEISPYKKGEYFDLEKTLSVWNQVSPKYGKYEPLLYFIENDTIYIPKGVNTDVLERHFNCKVTNNYQPSRCQRMFDKYDIKLGPKDKIQEQSIDFLSQNRLPYCQYSLNLETSGGKTYCAIASFTKLNEKTLIIVNREYLSSHWKSEILKFTTIPEERIIQLDTDKIKKVIEYELEADVYIVLHQSLQAYARQNSWNDVNEFMSLAGIGIKIYDEAHEFISSSFIIDCFTNVKRTFYLTATLARSQYNENKMFKIMMSSACKFNDAMEEKEKKIHYIPLLYRSEIPIHYVIGMRTKSHGFSSYKFIDSALKNDPSNSFLNALYYALNESVERGNQILIVTPKKESVIQIEKFVRNIVGNSLSIGTIFSDNSAEKNLQNQSCDIISSTIKSCGTGFNPPNLQTIICGEPHTSEIMTHQLKGRLDRFKGEDTYFYDLIDKTIPHMQKIRNLHKDYMSTISKEVTEVDL